MNSILASSYPECDKCGSSTCCGGCRDSSDGAENVKPTVASGPYDQWPPVEQQLKIAGQTIAQLRILIENKNRAMDDVRVCYLMPCGHCSCALAGDDRGNSLCDACRMQAQVTTLQSELESIENREYSRKSER